MIEEWKPVIGYEGLYEVSNTGNVRSIYREGVYESRWGKVKMKFPGKMLTINKTKKGYCYVGLSKDSVQTKHLVHRIVMFAFVGVNDRQVNHIDGVKTNNNITNLEYCTQSENLIHASRVLGTRRGKSVGSKFDEIDIVNIRSDRRKLREIAKDYGVTLQAIHLIKKRKNFAWVK